MLGASRSWEARLISWHSRGGGSKVGETTLTQGIAAFAPRPEFATLQVNP